MNMFEVSCVWLQLHEYYNSCCLFHSIIDGSVVINKIGNRLSRMKASSQSAMTWLHMYAIQFGEKLPNQEKIHLPPCVTKKSIYSEMVEYQHDKGEPEVISMSHFMLLWRTCLCHIAIPKVTNPFNDLNHYLYIILIKFENQGIHRH